MLTLNIGLHTNDGGKLNATNVLHYLQTIGNLVLSHAVHISDSEPTLVVKLHGYHHGVADLQVASLMDNIARTLRQDCIGVWDGIRGALIGPKAAAWGEFNPEYFLSLDGSRLAEPVAA